MKQKAFAAAKVIVTILLFIIIFLRKDAQGNYIIPEFIETMRNARIGFLVDGFLILLICNFICIYRWRLLMSPLMPIPSWKNLFNIYCIGLFFNMIFPSLIGGDFVKMYYAGKPSGKYAQSFAATFLDRDAGMFAMMIIACIAVLIYPVAVPGIPVGIIIWSIFIAFVIINIGIFVPRFHRLLTDILTRLKLSKIAAKVDTISSAFQVMGKHKSVLFWSFMISLVNQLLASVITWFTALGLLHSMQIPFYYFLIFVPVITLISMIPLSVGGMGLREGSFIALFETIGVTSGEATALGLLASIFLILTSLPGGIAYIFFKNRADMQQLTELETEFS
jgi:glycosyltransferase 2 family protein